MLLNGGDLPKIDHASPHERRRPKGRPFGGVVVLSQVIVVWKAQMEATLQNQPCPNPPPGLPQASPRPPPSLRQPSPNRRGDLPALEGDREGQGGVRQRLQGRQPHSLAHQKQAIRCEKVSLCFCVIFFFFLPTCLFFSSLFFRLYNLVQLSLLGLRNGKGAWGGGPGGGAGDGGWARGLD